MTINDPTMPHSLILFAAATALLFAAAHDVAVRTVPNLVSLIVAAAGLGLNAMDGQLVQALFGGGVVFAGAWYLWRRNLIGGGDVKLLTACVLLVPPILMPELILTTALSGGLLALIYIALARTLKYSPIPRPEGLPARLWRVELRRIRRGLSLPYACAIAAGVLLTLCSPKLFS
jgi:prepilin peptidase CpaA